MVGNLFWVLLGNPWYSKSDATLEEILAAIDEQATVLLAGNPDGLLLETYYDFEELTATLSMLRAKRNYRLSLKFLCTNPEYYKMA